MTDTVKSLQVLATSVGLRIFIRVLKDGPGTSGALKLGYYGAGRTAARSAKGSNSQRSYNEQRLKALAEGIIRIVPTTEAYELTLMGKELLAYCQENNVDLNIKSEAQVAWETKNA
jgi:hypothetical protein